MAKWLYKVIRITAYDAWELQDKLNEYGADGWELVNLQQNDNDYKLVLKMDADNYETK